MKRRDFLQSSAYLAGLGWVAASLPSSLRELVYPFQPEFGFQSWTIREALGKDLSGTLQSMAAMGYRQIEMCSPKGYEQIGFGPLAKLSTADLRAAITDAGLTCPSCHFGFGELKDHLDERIAFAKELGLRHMILSTFWLPRTAKLDDYLTAADQLNKIGEKVQQAGLQLGFHNHEFEFATLGGKLIYDALLERFDSKLVKLQFQTQVVTLGFKAADYLRQHPGRFISAHLSDWTGDKKEAAIGQGIIDWKDFFVSATTGGVQTFFVEMNADKFKDSAAYLLAR